MTITVRLLAALFALASPAPAAMADPTSTEADDRALMEAHQIHLIVSKNAGGTGAYAKIAAARALMDSDLDAEAIARKAMAIASDICVYTNGNLTVETIGK